MAGHPIVHMDIPATDPKAAGAFYAAVFDWQVQTDPTYDYTMFQAEGGPAGGFTQVGRAGDAVPFQYRAGEVLVYINTDDIEDSLSKVAAHGGTAVLPKTEIPGVGWWAVFRDPSGNHIGLFTAAPRAHSL
jgi:predicted enzyme related to lactoylglutathione lyase